MWRCVAGQILEGSATVVVGVIALFVLVDYPATAMFLTPEERAFIVWRQSECYFFFVSLLCFSISTLCGTVFVPPPHSSTLPSYSILCFHHPSWFSQTSTLCSTVFPSLPHPSFCSFISSLLPYLFFTFPLYPSFSRCSAIY